MKQIGRFLQIAALIILPLSMLFELSGILGRSYGLADMLRMLLVGVSLFCLGRIIEGYASPRE